MKVILFLLAIATTVAMAGDKLFVVNSLDESLGWIDYYNGESNPHAATLGYIPNDIVAFPQALCVVNSGDNNIQIIDPITLQTIRVIELDGVVNPWGATIHGSTKIAVTASVSGTVSIVDWSAGVVDTTFYVGISPQYIEKVYGKLYVLCTGVEFPVFGNGVLKRYDVNTLAFIDSLVVGVNPQSMLAAWDEIHVLCTGNYDDIEGSVVIIDTAGVMEIESELFVGGAPISMGLGTAPGIASGWIAAGGWGTEGYVYQYNAIQHEILHGQDNPIVVGAGAVDIEANGYDSWPIYVSCFNDNIVQILSCWGDLAETYEMSSGPSAMDFWFSPSAVAPEIVESIPQHLQITSAYPNPFNGSVLLDWTGQLRTPNTIKIFDILGQTVGEMPIGAGSSWVNWMPRSAGGQEVAAGVYFARFADGNIGRPIRIVYLK